jgi:hypothetical protein
MQSVLLVQRDSLANSQDKENQVTIARFEKLLNLLEGLKTVQAPLKIRQEVMDRFLTAHNHQYLRFVFDNHSEKQEQLWRKYENQCSQASSRWLRK